ncbi:MAG: PAS domain-containing sensor histidine kinase, partial [Chloroflexi bacterium]
APPLRALRGEHVRDEEEIVRTPATGELRFRQVNAVPVKDEHGRLLGSVSIVRDITERKQAEAALRRIEARWNAAIESFAEGVIIATENEQVIYWNPAAREMHGFTRPDEGIEPLEKTPVTFQLWTLAGSHMLALDEWPMRRIKRGETVRNLELRIRRPDQGWEKIFAYSGAMVDTAGGERLIFLTCHDLTELRRAELARRESEERFRLALRNAPVSVAAQDRDLRYIWAYNQRSARPDQIIGHFDHEIFNAEEAAHFTAIKRRVLEEGIEQREQMWVDRPGGRMYLDISWEPVRDNAGNIVGVASASVDLTPNKLAETAVRESEERLRLALDAANMVAWEYDPTTLKVTFSENAEKVLELPRRFENSDQGYNLIHPDDMEHHRALVTGAIATGGSYVSVYRHSHSDQVIWLEEHGRAVVDPSGKIIRLVGVVQNITERKQAEDTLREQMVQIELHRRLLEYREQERQMIARDLHDGPIQDLSGMLFQIQFAKEAITDLLIRVELDKIALGLKSTVQNMRELINEMRPPSLIRFGLSRAIRIYLEEFDVKYPEIEVNASLLEDNDHLSEQARLGLYRIVQEALANVVKHAGARSITVLLSQADQQAVLEIRDDGKGFQPSKNLLDYSSDGHYGLVGMKERAEAIGGMFHLQTFPGSGTTIQVIVPRAAGI